MNTIKLKVCGMRDAENIRQLAALKPDYIGFIFYEKSQRFVQHLAHDVVYSLSESINKTGVFVNATQSDILKKINEYQLNAIQLHGNETPEFCHQLKSNKIELIKAFGIDENFDFSILNAYTDAIDYFLFDTKTTMHGGSGITFNWNILKKYTLNKPYFLSGGLDIENIDEALLIEDERFYALDVNSRFEVSPGLKDIEKLKLLFNKIQIPA